MFRRSLALLALGMAVVAPVAKVAEAGPVGGPKHGTGCVEAHSVDVYHVVCWAGEVTRVLVDGDGDTDLDVYVYDENGNLITLDEDFSDTCRAAWTPRWTGEFTIHVVNRGHVYNHYHIVVE